MNTSDMHIPSNKVRDIERYILGELEGRYPEGEVRMFIRMLFEAFEGWDMAMLLSRREETVNQSDLLRFHWAVEDLKRWRPIQQIIGWTEFCGCRIAVDEHTLIPRPETEEIVERIMTTFEGRPPRLVADLCTGSGCIAIALAKRWPEATVIAVDYSEEALNKARENATANGVTIDFRKMDLLHEEQSVLPHPIDLIVSNPPYVMEQERQTMQRNVLDWEPATALFVEDTDPLIFYRAIAAGAQTLLNETGMAVVEINEKLGEATASLFRSYGFTAQLETDFRGKERSIRIAKRTASRTT